MIRTKRTPKEAPYIIIHLIEDADFAHQHSNDILRLFSRLFGTARRLGEIEIECVFDQFQIHHLPGEFVLKETLLGEVSPAKISA